MTPRMDACVSVCECTYVQMTMLLAKEAFSSDVYFNSGSAAERAGLQVGDVVLRMNNIDISEASVQEVLEIIGKGQ